MKINITYPSVDRNHLKRRRAIRILRWPFLIAAYTCPIVNLFTGGPLWCIVVLFALFMVWNLSIELDLVEYNRISQFIKTVIYSCGLIFLIDVILAPGWAVEVISIICFSALTVSGILFFTDLQRQKQNMLPMLFLIIVTMIWAIIGLVVSEFEGQWTLVVMGSISIALLLGTIIVLGMDFLREIVKAIHMK